MPEVLLSRGAEGSHAVDDGPADNEAGVGWQCGTQDLVHAVRHPHLREPQPVLQLVGPVLRPEEGDTNPVQSGAHWSWEQFMYL